MRNPGRRYGMPSLDRPTPAVELDRARQSYRNMRNRVAPHRISKMRFDELAKGIARYRAVNPDAIQASEWVLAATEVAALVATGDEPKAAEFLEKRRNDGK